MPWTTARFGLAAVLFIGACVVDVDFSGADFLCSDGQCPAGRVCRYNRCVVESASPDASSPVADSGALAPFVPAFSASGLFVLFASNRPGG